MRLLAGSHGMILELKLGMTKRKRGPSSFIRGSRDKLGFTGLHFDNLFDEDETRSGDTIDPATGLPIDNSNSYLQDLDGAGVSLHGVDWSNDGLPDFDDPQLDELKKDPEINKMLGHWEKQLQDIEQGLFATYALKAPPERPI